MSGQLSDRLRESTDAQFEEDWKRQRLTAADILLRLKHQEGVILADQVGMGKTYVALAVAVSQILATPKPGKVVVFAPAAVAEKWIREWEKFSETLVEPGKTIRCVPEAIRSGEDFFKALDGTPQRSYQLIVVTHTALTTDVKDTFVQLALLYYATKHLRDVDDLRGRIAKWSVGHSGLIRDRRFTEERVEMLLSHKPQEWRDVWHSMLESDATGDEVIPTSILDVISNSDFEDLRSVLRRLPVNRSANVQDRIDEVRELLKSSMDQVWKRSLSSMQLDLPLLIVDEAHRLKNPQTRISKLFAERSDDPAAGALKGVFRRMLFLTATPFELGHSELINVLSRMGAVRALRPAPVQTLESRLDELKKVLTLAQTSAITFDESWGRLGRDDLEVFDEWDAETPAPMDASAAAREAWEHARLAVRTRRDMHAVLRTWVIRHARRHRRSYLAGRAILGEPHNSGMGLEIPENAALPFLLAARAQSVALDQAGPARPLFAYGIASSYEAFGRLGGNSGEDGIDSDQANEDRDRDDPSRRQHVAGAGVVSWYRREIDEALGNRKVRDSHPKVKATVEKAARLWLGGNKCLIFCWFIRSGEAVERALNSRIDQLIGQLAATALHVKDEHEASAALDRISDRLFRKESSSHDRIRERLLNAIRPVAGGHDDVLELIGDAAIRHMRTHGYLVRYTSLAPDLDDEGVWAGLNGQNSGGIVLLNRWRHFAERLAKARDQIQSADPFEQHDSEFSRVSTALLGVRSEEEAGGRRGASLRDVRRATGQSDRHDRERLIALFNTPFAPDILVASSVMGEGIDLHQECRHVIHHDLDWNPGVLEQRTGRLDRIGALAEREGMSIEVYEPFLAGTHDEKMYRVVKDRAGWFDIVMGRPSGSDEKSTDAEEGRMPLHPKIADALEMNLTSPGASR